jgi:glycosyltransferase involved in cell wall biosynthesis
MLQECIASVKAQTRPVIHKVVLDDKKIGAPAIRNQAVESATTEWVLFLDDDDLIHPQHIEAIEPFLDNYDVIMTWPEYMGAPVQPTWLWQEFDPPILDSWCPWSQCAAVRRQSYLDAGGQPEGVVFEDWALWKRLRDTQARFKVVPQKLWMHRWHQGQRTREDMIEYQAGKRQLN